MTTTTTSRPVLVVDDSSIDRMIAERVLNKTNRFGAVLTAADGEEALALYVEYARTRQLDPERFPPIVVLVDVNMPGMNGFRLVDEIDRLGIDFNSPHHMVILSSSTARADRARADAHPGIAAYFVKPATSRLASDLADRFVES